MARSVDTTKITGGADYAKVAERLKQFREDWPNSKLETDHTTKDDRSTEFKAWIWKDKTEYLDVLKAVGDAKQARGSADADGDSQGMIDPNKNKEYEKLQTIAIGRALANLGYLSSGEIASFEEMEEYYKKKKEQQQEYIQEQVDLLESAKTLDELKDIWSATNKALPDILLAKNLRKRQLEQLAKDLPVKQAKHKTSKTKVRP